MLKDVIEKKRTSPYNENIVTNVQNSEKTQVRSGYLKVIPITASTGSKKTIDYFLYQCMRIE